MEIRLYTCKDPKNKIKKTLADGIILEGTLRDGCSVLDPEILVEVSNASVYNYAYIPDFDRYYHVSGCEVYRTSLWSVRLHVDVLMTYADGILSSNATITDATDPSEKYINGSQYTPTVMTKTDVINFPGKLPDDGEYILIVSGGNV